jgi:hypothetical protein
MGIKSLLDVKFYPGSALEEAVTTRLRAFSSSTAIVRSQTPDGSFFAHFELPAQFQKMSALELNAHIRAHRIVEDTVMYSNILVRAKQLLA